MEKGKGGIVRRWAIEFTDNSTAPSSLDVPDPPGFTRASHDQDDSTLTRQKKDAESNWKAQKAWEVAHAPIKNSAQASIADPLASWSGEKSGGQLYCFPVVPLALLGPQKGIEDVSAHPHQPQNTL